MLRICYRFLSLLLRSPLPRPHHCPAVETAPNSRMVEVEALEAAAEHGATGRATAEAKQLHKTVLMTCIVRIVLAGGDRVAIIEDGAEAISKRHMAVCR